MRAWEILTEYEDRGPPSKPMTLRALHQIKHEQRRREESDSQRRLLMPIMYGQDDPREFELAKRELENDRRELELDQRKAEVDLLDQQIQQAEKSHDHIRKMAWREVGRRAKD